MRGMRGARDRGRSACGGMNAFGRCLCGGGLLRAGSMNSAGFGGSGRIVTSSIAVTGAA